MMTKEKRELAIADMRKLKAEYMNGRKLDVITERKCKSFDMAIKALEQEPKTDYKSFCEFVAKTVMEEDFEINAGANAEIFCRKLADLGIIRADGDSWVLESGGE